MNIEFKENYEIKNLTSFKIGGKVKKIYFPKNIEEFTYLLSSLKDILVLGNASNVLFSSNGYDGEVISTSKLTSYEINETRVKSECGVRGAFLAQKVADKGLAGFEFMIGFPGSVGGNVYMNAGAHLQSISDKLVMVTAFDIGTKKILNLAKDELEFSYRHSIFQEKPYVVLSAEFELDKSTPELVKTLMNRNVEFRKEHQPSLNEPNAGSIFKNPENDSAGRLLDKAGVKVLSVGGAKVWHSHANFIVNYNNATSEDVLQLMFNMYEMVKDKYKLELEPEVKFFGNKTAREEELCKVFYQK